jgi:hypothetical protein
MTVDLRAKVFQDREDRDGWRVEKIDEDGGYECVEVFAGPNARQGAIDYARHRFGDFDEIVLEAISQAVGHSPPPSLRGNDLGPNSSATRGRLPSTGSSGALSATLRAASARSRLNSAIRVLMAA